MSDTPRVTDLTVHQHSKLIEVSFDDGGVYRIPFELLRVYSPSAEVQGHGPGQATLQTGKRDVGVVDIEPVGHYGVKPTFSDGHASGIYSWAYLHHLARDQDALWQDYERRLAEAGIERDAPMAGKPGSACGTGH